MLKIYITSACLMLATLFLQGQVVANESTVPSVELGNKAPLSCTATITPSGPTSFCAGRNVRLTASGGTSYLWDSSSSNAVRTIGVAGTYCVTVTDGSGCTASACQTITVLPAVTVNAGPDGFNCGAGIALNATGGAGAPPYTYNWNNGLGLGASQNVNPVNTTTYIVTVTDNNGCSASDQLVISASQLTISPNVTVCRGQSTPLGVTGTFCNIAWGPAAGLSGTTTQNVIASPTVTSVYTATVTQCGANLVTNPDFSQGNTGFTTDYVLGTGGSWGLLSNERTYTITTSPRLAHNNFSVCGDHTSGMGNMFVANGATTTNVGVWSQSFAVVPNTDYVLSLWASVALQDPATPQLQFVINGVNNGPILTPPNLPCTWSQLTTTWNSGANTSVALAIRNLNTAGSGNDFMLDDISFSPVCISTQRVTVTVSAPPVASIAGNTALSCAATSTTLTASGGDSYSWSNGLGNNAASSPITAAGRYVVTATNLDGCTGTAAATVTASGNAPTATFTTSDGNARDLTCTRSNIGVTVNFDAVNNTIVWGAPFSGSNPVQNITTAGTYPLTITNNISGCTATLSLVINTNTVSPLVSFPVSPTITCSSSCVTLTPSANPNTSTMTWSTGATSNTLQVCSAGTYSVTATNPANGCTASASVAVSADSNVPTVTVSTAPANATVLTCALTTITITASFDVANNTIAWGGPLSGSNTNPSQRVIAADTYPLTITNTLNGCTATASVVITSNTAAPAVSVTPTSAVLNCTTTSTTLTASGASSYVWSSGQPTAAATFNAAGTYTVVGTDASNGCTATATAVVTSSSNVPTATFTTNNGNTREITCAITSIGVRVNFDAANNTIVWGAPFSGSNPVQNVTAAGTYPLTITNNISGCTATQSLVITSNTVLPVLTLPLSATITCSSACVTLTPSVNPNTSTMVWSTGATTNDLRVCTAGSYAVTATNPANGCVAVRSTGVVVSVTDPIIAFTYSVTNCNFANTTITASGGVSYTWSTGETTSTIATTALGSYQVTVLNAAGCPGTATAVVQPLSGSPAFTHTVSNETCPGYSNGSISVTRTSQGLFADYFNNMTLSGSPVYSTLEAPNYDWAAAAPNIAINPNLFSVRWRGQVRVPVTGAYTFYTNSDDGIRLYIDGVLVIDNWTDHQVTLNTATPITFTANSLHDVFMEFYENNGLAVAQLLWSYPGQGQVAIPISFLSPIPIEYSLNGGAFQTSTTFAGLTNGIYSVTSRDTYGCTASSSITVSTANPAPLAAISPVNPTITCSTPTATLTASGGSSYRWSSGSTSASLTTSAAGLNSVTVTSAGGCTATAAMNVASNTTPPSPVLSTSPFNITELTCNNTTIGLNAKVDPSLNTIAWGAPLTGSAFLQNITRPGTYTITVTSNANGCTASASVLITQNNTAPLVVASPTSFVLDCITTSTTVTASGASSYVWSGGQTTAATTYNAAGTYTVTGTDFANGCTASASAQITNNAQPPVINLASSVQVCTGGTVTVSPTVNVTGATYAWQDGSTSLDYVVGQAGTYSLTVTLGSCTATSSIVATEQPCTPTACPFSFPNIFTPNNDGTNETFGIISACQYPQYEMLIFNRWGQIVFKATEQTQAWDGTYKDEEAPIDSYVYVVYFVDPISGARSLQRQGDFALVR